MIGQEESNNHRILIIDDNNDIHSDFQKVLVLKKGNEELERIESLLFNEKLIKPKQNFPTFEVDFASQGEEGYQKIVDSLKDNNPYAMAFVDIRMPPGWNGIETVQKIWELDPRIEIVFCSAYSDFSLADIYQKLINKKNEFLVIKKPFDVVEIKQTAASMCQIWNLKRKLEKRIEEVEGQLLHADKMASLGRLAAGVAHEINNPIGYINSNINTLQKYVEELLRLITIYQEGEPNLIENSDLLERITEVKDKIDLDFLKKDVISLIQESSEGVERVKKIIQDLKEFSHRGSTEWDRYNLNNGIDSTLNIIQSEIKSNDIQVIKKLGNLPTVQAIGPQINQVILNILVNAVHAMKSRENRRLTIETSQLFGMVQVKISDTGHGIRKECLTKIFEPFFTTKSVGQGTGLGLYLSYGIVQKHHGKLEVESKENDGSTFTLSLPIVQSSESNQSVA
ncbi:MAG: ATP-binding protein [Gammaproteobacteria bacterium]